MTTEVRISIDQKKAKEQLEDFRKDVEEEEKVADSLQDRGRKIRRDGKRRTQAGRRQPGGSQGVLAKLAGLQIAFQGVKATLGLVQTTTEVLAQRLDEQGDAVSKLTAKVLRSVGEVAGLGQKVAAISEAGQRAIEGAILPFAAAGVGLQDSQIEQLIERSIALKLRDVDLERRKRARSANHGLDVAAGYAADKVRKMLGGR